MNTKLSIYGVFLSRRVIFENRNIATFLLIQFCFNWWPSVDFNWLCITFKFAYIDGECTIIMVST